MIKKIYESIVHGSDLMLEEYITEDTNTDFESKLDQEYHKRLDQYASTFGFQTGAELEAAMNADEDLWREVIEYDDGDNFLDLYLTWWPDEEGFEAEDEYYNIPLKDLLADCLTESLTEEAESPKYIVKVYDNEGECFWDDCWDSKEEAYEGIQDQYNNWFFDDNDIAEEFIFPVLSAAEHDEWKQIGNDFIITNGDIDESLTEDNSTPEFSIGADEKESLKESVANTIKEDELINDFNALIKSIPSKLINTLKVETEYYGDYNEDWQEGISGFVGDIMFDLPKNKMADAETLGNFLVNHLDKTKYSYDFQNPRYNFVEKTISDFIKNNQSKIEDYQKNNEAYVNFSIFLIDGFNVIKNENFDDIENESLEESKQLNEDARYVGDYKGFSIYKEVGGGYWAQKGYSDDVFDEEFESKADIKKAIDDLINSSGRRGLYDRFGESLTEDINTDNYETVKSFMIDIFNSDEDLACDDPDVMDDYSVEDPKDYARENHQYYADNLDEFFSLLDDGFFDAYKDAEAINNIDREELKTLLLKYFKEFGYLNESLTENLSSNQIIKTYEDNVYKHYIELQDQEDIFTADAFIQNWYELKEVRKESNMYALVMNKPVESLEDAELIANYAFNNIDEDALENGGIVQTEGDNIIYVEETFINESLKEDADLIKARVADVEYVDDDLYDRHVLIYAGDLEEEEISDELYDDGMTDVWINDIYEKEIPNKHYDICDVIEIYDDIDHNETYPEDDNDEDFDESLTEANNALNKALPLNVDEAIVISSDDDSPEPILDNNIDTFDPENTFQQIVQFSNVIVKDSKDNKNYILTFLTEDGELTNDFWVYTYVQSVDVEGDEICNAGYDRIEEILSDYYGRKFEFISDTPTDLNVRGKHFWETTNEPEDVNSETGFDEDSKYEVRSCFYDEDREPEYHEFENFDDAVEEVKKQLARTDEVDAVVLWDIEEEDAIFDINTKEKFMTAPCGPGADGDIWYIGYNEDDARNFVDQAYPDWIRYGLSGDDTFPYVLKLTLDATLNELQLFDDIARELENVDINNEDAYYKAMDNVLNKYNDEISDLDLFDEKSGSWEIIYDADELRQEAEDESNYSIYVKYKDNTEEYFDFDDLDDAKTKMDTLRKNNKVEFANLTNNYEKEIIDSINESLNEDKNDLADLVFNKLKPQLNTNSDSRKQDSFLNINDILRDDYDNVVFINCTASCWPSKHSNTGADIKTIQKAIKNIKSLCANDNNTKVFFFTENGISNEFFDDNLPGYTPVVEYAKAKPNTTCIVYTGNNINYDSIPGAKELKALSNVKIKDTKNYIKEALQEAGTIKEINI